MAKRIVDTTISERLLAVSGLAGKPSAILASAIVARHDVMRVLLAGCV